MAFVSGDHSPVRTLIGRDAELDLIDRLVATSASQIPIDGWAPRGTGLLLNGQPGVGKSALLDAAAAAAAAAGVLALRATGVESKAGHPYSGLAQVLHPLGPNPLVQNPVAAALDRPADGH